jgi:hypothetical protein
MPDTEPQAILDLTSRLQQRQQESERQHNVAAQAAPLFEAFAHSGDYRALTALATLFGVQRAELATATPPEGKKGQTNPSFYLDLTTLPDESRESMQTAAAQALLQIALQVQSGLPTSLFVHTADHVEGYPDEAVVSLYARGSNPKIPLEKLPEKPKLSDLLNIIGQRPSSEENARDTELIPTEAAYRPLITFVTEGWKKTDKAIEVSSPKVTSMMFANVANGPRIVSPSAPSGGQK